MKQKPIRLLILGVGILSILVTLVWVVFFDGLGKISTSGESNLAVMRLYLNGVTLNEIYGGSKETKYEGNSAEIEDGEMKLDFLDVQVKGRGNSTWSGPKRPLQIKFKKKVDLLGLGKRKKYILLANVVDYSSVRNALMFHMAEMIDEKYRMRGEFIELFVDDDYQGLYYLTTKVEIGKNAVDIRNKYGVLFELDNLWSHVDDCHYSKAGECLVLKEAVFENDDVAKVAAEDFMASFNELEVAAKKRDFAAVSEVIDVRSFAEYFLISEFAVNPDAYVSSFYFYKDGKDDKIHAGPLWDYDYAFSNREWYKTFFSPIETMAQREQVFAEKNKDSDKRKLMYYLIEIPEFKEEVERIFQEKLSGRKIELELMTARDLVRIKEAALKDERKWREGEETFLKEGKYLMNWLDRRFDYFEKEYGKNKIEDQDETIFEFREPVEI